MGVVEFNHNPAKFYHTKMLKRRDKKMAPQMILGFVYPVDKVGQYLIYVKYCSTQRWHLKGPSPQYLLGGGSCITVKSLI